VRGEVKLKSFTADPMAVASYGTLETADATRSFHIETLRAAGDGLVARLAGIADRAAAERLRNLDLYVPRERLPPTEDDETFYHVDLIGLSAVTRAGQNIGTVAAIYNFGAGDLVELRPASGGATLLLPFNTNVVPVIDVAAGQIVVEAPAEDSGSLRPSRAAGSGRRSARRQAPRGASRD
jgi:16S rRNA processing protein RimM